MGRVVLTLEIVVLSVTAVAAWLLINGPHVFSSLPGVIAP